MKRKGTIKRLREQGGVTLVEVLIGVIILSVALLGLAAAGGVAARQVYRGRVDMGRLAALQQELESLVAQGYDNVTAGSDTVQGYPMSWTVTGTNPKQITLVVTREDFRRRTVQDTLVTFLADPEPDPE
jgi:prepilin-type N-terminal cleavage/methylation domain-containing protein